MSLSFPALPDIHFKGFYFLVTCFEGFHFSVIHFKSFLPFRSSISKVSTFSVTHFEGFPPFQFSPFWLSISEVPAFLVIYFEDKKTEKFILNFDKTLILTFITFFVFAFSVAHFKGSSISFSLVKFEMMVKVFRLSASK
ncbi:hypothetical protein RhiirA1_463743 [Rhizophagus irregularis]|uniref:Uncharacterized protein n=1 Tax=Rhizophagus irregularis TaxID=588596 RepID=A0A2N0RJG2_9GLOM|nr:hypothetical protein RhiirA1_463743 [Rhizophagus irregularis]